MSNYDLIVGGTVIAVTSSSPGVAAYNLTVDVVRVTPTRTARGQTESTAVIVADMPCGIRWLKGKEAIEFNKDTHTLDGILHCRVPAVTIIVQDRIVYSGDTYEITNILDVNNLGTLLELSIKKDN